MVMRGEVDSVTVAEVKRSARDARGKGRTGDRILLGSDVYNSSHNAKGEGLILTEKRSDFLAGE